MTAPTSDVADMAHAALLDEFRAALASLSRTLEAKDAFLVRDASERLAAVSQAMQEAGVVLPETMAASLLAELHDAESQAALLLGLYGDKIKASGDGRKAIRAYAR